MLKVFASPNLFLQKKTRKIRTQIMDIFLFRFMNISVYTTGFGIQSGPANAIISCLGISYQEFSKAVSTDVFHVN